MLNTAEEVHEALMAAREQLLRSVRDLTPEVLAVRPARDEWSILDVFSHLVDVDRFYLSQALAMRDANDYLFQYFDDEAWKPANPNVPQESLAQIVERLEASQAEVLTALSQLSQAELDHAGRHPLGIDYCVRDVFLRLPAHDIAHRRQITAIVSSLTQPAQ